ncbi:hypothetical protein KCP77_23285 [Salmonella enterica subsp. enterica]|nr:hypothetical protein KCP77_23285 [Salmonella enterica subsp. enterica]
MTGMLFFIAVRQSGAGRCAGSPMKAYASHASFAPVQCGRTRRVSSGRPSITSVRRYRLCAERGCRQKTHRTVHCCIPSAISASCGSCWCHRDR